MSKIKGIVSAYQVKPGDIISYAPQGTLMERRAAGDVSYGYVHHVETDAQDKLVAFRVLPIMHLEKAEKTDFRFHTINVGNTGDNLGLHPDKTWAMILAPERVAATPQQLGRKDANTVLRMGSIAGTTEDKAILNQIEDMGGDSKLYYGPIGAPQMKKPSEATWGLYVPLGVSAWRDDNEAQSIEPKRKYRRKGPEGAVLDISLNDAVKAFGLDPELAATFGNPVDKRIKPAIGLRHLFNMADKDQAAMDKFIEAVNSEIPNLPLKDMEDRLTPQIVEALTIPNKWNEDTPRRIKPITHLHDLHKIVTKHPDDLDHYYYFTFIPQMKPALKFLLPRILEDIMAPQQPAEVKKEAIPHIKDVWKRFVKTYGEHMGKAEIPAEYKGEDGKPVWKLVKGYEL